MTDEGMTPDKATALRRPFPPESIGRLPKGGQMLDFAGHAAVTDRLLSVDPHWSWDFAETDPATGLPSLRYSIDPEKNLWIRLTICGVTRIGVGDGPTAKERIGDALRNAAMRFGVGLDLWAKENLVEFANAATTASRQAETPIAPSSPAPPAAGSIAHRNERNAAKTPVGSGPLQAKTRGRMFALFGELQIPDDEQLRGINHILGTSYTSRKELTEADGQAVIKRLVEKQQQTTREGQPA